MTQTEREALEALRQKATQGEWKSWQGAAGRLIALVPDDDGDGEGIYTAHRDTFRAGSREDAALIVAAVNALPALLADSKALAEVAEVAGELLATMEEEGIALMHATALRNVLAKVKP